MCIFVINVCRVLCFNLSQLKPEQINIRDHTAESSEVGVNADSTFRPVLLGSFCSVNEVFRVQFQEFCWCLSYKLYHHKKIFSCESYLMIDRTFFNSVANLEACGKKNKHSLVCCILILHRMFGKMLCRAASSVLKCQRVQWAPWASLKVLILDYTLKQQIVLILAGRGM